MLVMMWQKTCNGSCTDNSTEADSKCLMKVMFPFGWNETLTDTDNAIKFGWDSWQTMTDSWFVFLLPADLCWIEKADIWSYFVKIHWAISRSTAPMLAFCPHWNAFSIMNPYMKVKIWISNFVDKSCAVYLVRKYKIFEKES